MNEILFLIENEPLITTNRKVMKAGIICRKNKNKQEMTGNQKLMQS